jgi:predicted metal-dependent enzyme (double-stranded beta helix superfamily)
MTAALDVLVAAVESALADSTLDSDRARADVMRPAMAALLTDDDPIAAEGRDSLDGEAVGNLLYADPDGRFHVLAVVFPEGTSSGIHHHGCWGVIGYLQGGDEETRYAGAPPDDNAVELEEASRHVWHQGDITYLLPEEGEGWHRVRNPGPGTGVSVHVLCMTPAAHPHHYWNRDAHTTTPFPFVEMAPGRWQARLG